MILFPVLFPLTPETLKAFWQSASIDEMPTQGLLEEIHGSRYRRTRALLHQKTQPEPAKSPITLEEVMGQMKTLQQQMDETQLLLKQLASRI